MKGVEGYSIDGADAIRAAPTNANGVYLTELDLTGLKDTGLDIISLGAHIFRSNGGLKISLSKLHLPDTIIQTSGSSFITTSTILDFEPHEFPDLVTHATPGVPTALFANPVVSFPNPGYKTYPQQMWQAVGAKKIYLGYGLTAFGNYAFDSAGATDIYLTGDAVPTTGTSWHRGTSIIRINVPIYSDEWKAYAETSAADPTTAQQTTYAKNFPDGRELWKVGTSGSYSGLYLAKWAPDDYCRNALHVRGNVSAGEVTPAYGKHKYVAQSVAVSAPAAATYESVDYVCAGYVLEALGDDGWGAPVTNRNVNAFTLARDDETSYRVTWLWEVAGFTLALDTTPPSGLTYDALSIVPASSTGMYTPGTVVTLTAPATGSGDWADAVFDHWEGDVPPGNEKANPLAVTMDRAKSLTPVYAANWRAVAGYATTRITDGYFTLKCTTTGNEISLGNSCGLVIGGVDVLDLRKPVADGRVITALTGYTFSPNAGSQMYPFDTIVFPDTLKTISTGNLGGGMFGYTGVGKLVNTFPATLETFSGGLHGLSQSWEGGPVYLLNKKLTAVPSQIFGGYAGGHAYHLGVNIASIPNHAFDNNSGTSSQSVSVYLYGDKKPAFGGGDWHRNASPARVVVPRTSAEWKAWLAANTTVPTSAQTNTYNTTFADREPGEKLIGIGKNVDYQNGVYFCTWPSPAAAGGTILFLR